MIKLTCAFYANKKSKFLAKTQGAPYKQNIGAETAMYVVVHEDFERHSTQSKQHRDLTKR